MIYGSYIYGIADICHILDLLHVPFELHDSDLRYFKRSDTPVVSVANGINLVQRCKCDIVFVVDAKAALNKTNADQTLCKLMKTRQLVATIKECLKHKEKLDFVCKEHSLAEIVDKLTTKSILTDIQTLVNKIQPYDLRKEIHKMIITYLYGNTGINPLRAKLSGIPKFNALWKVISGDKCKTIRNAVIEYLKTKDEKAVAAKYQIHTFEILYVYNSYSKL